MHSQNRCLQNIKTINFFGLAPGDCPVNGILFYLLPQHRSAGLCHLFGVIKPGMIPFWRQDNCSSVHSSCQTTSACFIATRLHYALCIIAFERHAANITTPGWIRIRLELAVFYNCQRGESFPLFGTTFYGRYGIPTVKVSEN